MDYMKQTAEERQDAQDLRLAAERLATCQEKPMAQGQFEEAFHVDFEAVSPIAEDEVE